MSKQAFKRLRNWLRKEVAQEVPAGLVRCEFECKETECSMGRWDNCIKRLERQQQIERYQ